jgi:hypothetical protein
MLIIKIIALFLFSEWVNRYKYLQKYKQETRFNVYRSLMCLYFSLYSLEITINNFTQAVPLNIDLINDETIDISQWFEAYLILDIEKMILVGTGRWDLYLHHIWCLVSFFIAKFYDKCGYLHVFLLINESISIVSGLDSMYLEDDKKYESMICKKIRKGLIQYIRFPIWILVILITAYRMVELPSLLFWNSILTPALMIILDKYWEGKCQKVIDEYKYNI